jgi:hypothetical protein
MLQFLDLANTYGEGVEGSSSHVSQMDDDPFGFNQDDNDEFGTTEDRESPEDRQEVTGDGGSQPESSLEMSDNEEEISGTALLL